MAANRLPKAVQEELAAARRVMSRADQLARISAASNRTDRRYLSAEHKQANALVGEWMSEAGFKTSQDAVGNIVGEALGASANAATSRRIVLGSHLDTVPDAGRYDGMLGVLAAIEMNDVVASDYTLEIIGFGDEEGSRFGTTLMTSLARAGAWDEAWWLLQDENNRTLEQAFLDFGLSKTSVQTAARDADVYIELHIEQGPVLEAMDLPVGIVTGIAGAKRCTVTVKGLAGHAGTVPMAMRQDALLGAASCVTMTRDLALEHGLTATVGALTPKPGAVNVIAGQVEFSLDIRSLQSAEIDAYLDVWQQSARSLCAALDLTIDLEVYHDAAPALCSPDVQAAMARALDALQLPPHRMPSGAGHDAMAMQRICPVGMLFLRCEGGLSHHPDEAVTVEDVAWGLAALRGTLKQLTTNWELG